jgi:hypothetical protein
MTQLPKMTEAEAYLYLDFCAFRCMGWEVVERTKHHHASKAARAAGELWREIIATDPEIDVFIAAAMAGDPVHLLWPEHLQVEVERQFNTKVPRACNEPTSEEFIRSMHEGGRTDWVLPDFLKNHGREPLIEGGAA